MSEDDEIPQARPVRTEVVTRADEALTASGWNGNDQKAGSQATESSSDEGSDG